MRAVLKWTGAAFGLVAIVVAALAVNVIWFRPFDIRIFYDKVFVEFALEYPEFLSSMRLLEQFGIESHNDDLDDISPAQTLRYNAVVADALETLRKYDRSDLDGQVALSYDILEWYLQTEVDGADFAFHGYQFRKAIRFTAFEEGWGLYSEQLCREAGLIDDPYDDLGRLQLEMMRAVRLVVDTGIHAQGWSREQAIAYMRANTGMAERDVVSEIERYFVNPGQATAYKVGMHKLLELREHAQSVLGDEFDLRQFHDLVLDNGSMPLTVLERLIEDSLQTGASSNPYRKRREGKTDP